MSLRDRLFPPALPDAEQVLSQLHKPRIPRVRMDGLAIGFDNIHVDVGLSRRFLSRLTDYVRSSLRYDVEKNYWNLEPADPGPWEQQAMARVYRELMEVSVKEARAQNRPERVQLLQVTLLTCLLGVVNEELTRLRDFLQVNRLHEEGNSAGHNLELQQRLVILSRQEPVLRYRMLNRLFQTLKRVERGGLRKARKSILGISWPIAEKQFFNPLLWQSAPMQAECFAQHYPLALMPDGRGHFEEVNRLISDLLSAWLPEWAMPAGGEARQRTSADGLVPAPEAAPHALDIGLTLQRSLQGAELFHHRSSWLDVPRNMRLLFGSCGRRSGEQAWAGLRRHLIRGLHRQLRQFGLLPAVMASSHAPLIYKEMGEQVPLLLIYRFLANDLSKSKLRQQLEALELEQPDEAVRLLELGRRRCRPRGPFQSRRELLQFAYGFAALRRDMKLAYHSFVVMEQIRLLRSEEDLRTSRGNGTLYAYVLPDDDQRDKHRPIRGHVILKADVRGSTGITAMMRKKQLNPASYFSVNLFQPINALLADFGADKVFIEGDAVILSLLEYEDDPGQGASVALACGLARKILNVVAAKNVENRRHGLPEMELGVGIAYVNEAPTFVYDDNRKITISPAINRADRLAACHRHLRGAGLKGALHGRHVEVVVPDQPDEHELAVLRYNVGGIELDAPAFYKLKSQLALRRVLLDEGDEVFHAGRYPDLAGKSHWVVVREAPIRCWSGETIGEAEPRGRQFFEVVSDSAILSQVRAKLSPAARKTA